MGETKKKKAKNGRAAKKDAEFKALQKKRDEDFARNAAEQGKPAVDRDSLKNTRAADLNAAGLKARQDAIDPNRPGFTSKPEDVAKGGGSKLDHLDSYQASEFGSATPGERAQQDRRELNEEMHMRKKARGAARARYRYLRKNPKRGDAASYLKDMQAKGITWGGTMQAGEDARAADKSITQSRIHDITAGKREHDPKGDFFQRNIKQGDLANFQAEEKKEGAEVEGGATALSSFNEEDLPAGSEEWTEEERQKYEEDKAAYDKMTPAEKEKVDKEFNKIDPEARKLYGRSLKWMPNESYPDTPEGEAAWEKVKEKYDGKPADATTATDATGTGGGLTLASIAKEGETDYREMGGGPDEGEIYDEKGELIKKPGDAAGGGKNKFAELIDKIGEKEFVESDGGTYGPEGPEKTLSKEDRLAFRKELLTISEGIKEDPNFFRNNKDSIKTLFESLGIDEDKGKNVLRRHNKFQQVHKKDPVPKYLRPGQSRKPAHSNPFTPFSARTHKMVESGKRTPAQEPKGGWTYKNRPATIKRDQDRLMSNAGKTFATDDKEVNESFAAVRNMLTKSVLKKETSNHYAAQYRADLVDTYNDYSRLKGLGLDKDIPSPPTEKGIRENPESLNEWISKVGQAKLDQRPWDPKGKGYDMKTAKAHGMTADETGHWSSRSPKTGQILKGSGHKTYGKTEKGEAEAGHTIYQDPNSGKNYSHPARKMSDRPNIKNPNSPKSDLKNFKPKPKPKNSRTRRRR